MEPNAPRDPKDALLECAAFRQLPPELLEQVLHCMKPFACVADDLLIAQGTPGDALYLILEGSARVVLHLPDGADHTVGRLGPGDIAGEMSLLTREPRNADVIAEQPIRALRLPTDDFERLTAATPLLGVVLTELLAERLGTTSPDGLGGKLLDGYRVIRCLGRGGMSVVYEARREADDFPVALKMMSHRLLYQSGALARFRQEEEIAAGMRHENVARLFGSFGAYKTRFLVMELYDGPALGGWIRERGPFPEDEARSVLAQLARGLHYIHGLGVVHRDVKPRNVIVTRDGVVKLMDFGLSKGGLDAGDDTMTLPNTLIGTPSYMSLEQLSGKPLDSATDLYGWACTAYELVAGTPLFRPGDIVELIRQKSSIVLPPAGEIGHGISAELHELIRVGLSADPAERRLALGEIGDWPTVPLSP